MSYVYTETMLFTDREEGEAEGWTSDCNGKKDYDPVIVRICSRVWRDGTYSQSVIVGGDTYVHESGIQHAPSVIEARAAVEELAREHALRIISAVKAEYASAIEARSDATGTGAAEGESAAAESRDANNSSAELYFSKGGVK